METLPVYDVPINGNDLQRWLAGEKIRVLDLAEAELPIELSGAPGDWWLIDGRDVVAMQYHPDGRFMGASVLDPEHVSRHSEAADAVWRLATPFGSWWAAHPSTATQRALPFEK